MRADALHIALATVARVDVLVSWNFKHIVNLTRIHAYNAAANLNRGYPLLEIWTPRRSSTMNELKAPEVDCVKTAREARDRVSAQIEGMSHEQLVLWLRSYRYSDPVLARLAEKAAQQADPADGASRPS
jgi:hypothetical protein